MKNLIKKILIVAGIACMGVAAVAGNTYAVEQYTDLQSFYRATLTSSISSNATSIVVSNAPTVTTAFLVIDPRTPNQEIVKMTGRSGTTLTVIRGLSATSTSETDAGYKRSHAAGSSIEIVDVHFYLKQVQTSRATQFRGATTTAAIASINSTSTDDIAFSTDDQRWYVFNGTSWVKQGDNSETIGGNKTFSGTTTMTGVAIVNATATSPLHIANKSYVDTKVSLTGNETIAGIKAFTSSPTVPTPAGNDDAVNKAYADGLVVAGAPIANNTTTGIGRTATSTQYSKGYASTTPYFITSQFASSTASSSDSIVVATKAATGKIDPSFLNGSAESYTFAGLTTLASTTINGTTTYGGFPIYGNFGDGSDGDLTIAGGATTTLTRDTYYDNLTVNGGLVTDGFKLFVKGNLSGTGNITWGTPNVGGPGGAGTGGSGGGGAGGGISSGNGMFVSTAGANGGAGGLSNSTQGVVGEAKTSSLGATAGAASGNGANGAGGRAGGAGTRQTKVGIYAYTTLLGVDFTATGSSVAYQGGGGSAGGTGGHGAGAQNGGGGGGGGASCGSIYIAARNWGGSFVIHCPGAVGGAGGAPFSGTVFGGGGGGGGAGGSTLTIYETKTWTGTYSLAGGTGGAAGGSGAQAGTNGTAGTSFEINIRSMIR